MKRLRPLDSGDPDNPSKRALLFEAYRRPALDRPGTYDTRNLVVALVQRLGLRHATDLANLLGVTAPSVHRLCHHAGHPVSAAMLVAPYEGSYHGSRHSLGCPQLFGKGHSDCTCGAVLPEAKLGVPVDLLHPHSGDMQAVVDAHNPPGVQAMRAVRPPPGLRPQSCVVAGESAHARLAEVAEAIARYARAEVPIPREWAIESRLLLDQLDGYHRGVDAPG